MNTLSNTSMNAASSAAETAWNLSYFKGGNQGLAAALLKAIAVSAVLAVGASLLAGARKTLIKEVPDLITRFRHIPTVEPVLNGIYKISSKCTKLFFPYDNMTEQMDRADQIAEDALKHEIQRVNHAIQTFDNFIKARPQLLLQFQLYLHCEQAIARLNNNSFASTPITDTSTSWGRLAGLRIDLMHAEHLLKERLLFVERNPAIQDILMKAWDESQQTRSHNPLALNSMQAPLSLDIIPHEHSSHS